MIKKPEIKKISLHSKLRKMIKNNSVIVVTYVNEDNSVIKNTLTDNFLERKGKIRNINSIVNDLYAIMHDFNAKHFII